MNVHFLINFFMDGRICLLLAALHLSWPSARRVKLTGFRKICCSQMLAKTQFMKLFCNSPQKCVTIGKKRKRKRRGWGERSRIINTPNLLANNKEIRASRNVIVWHNFVKEEKQSWPEMYFTHSARCLGSWLVSSRTKQNGKHRRKLARYVLVYHQERQLQEQVK